jgi:hypothetical protein
MRPSEKLTVLACGILAAAVTYAVLAFDDVSDLVIASIL